VVIDGACRDVDGSEAVGFPVYARGGVPMTARGRIVEESYNAPVQFCGVAVHPGDLVIADGSGVVFIPQDRAEEALQAAEELAAKEQEMLAAIRAGRSILEVDKAANYEGMLQREGPRQ
jgi:regulator of RNase E activity RraA